MKIYKLIDPRDNKPKYVGYCSTSLEQRLKEHLCDQGNTPKINWIQKLKKLGLKPQIESIEDVTLENWQEREKYWIAEYRKIEPELKNYTDGGEIGPIRRGEKQKPAHIKNAGMAKRKITEEQDEEIRKLYLNEVYTIKKLSELYGIHTATIIRIIYGRVNHYEEKPNLKPKCAKGKLNFEKAEEIRKLYSEDQERFNQKVLASLYGVDPSSISVILSNKRYRKR